MHRIWGGAGRARRQTPTELGAEPAHAQGCRNVGDGGATSTAILMVARNFSTVKTVFS